MAALNGGFAYRKHLGADASGLTVIDYLTQHYSRFTRMEWLARIEAGRVLLDGIASAAETVLRPGGTLSWIRPPWSEPDVPESFAIIYRDDHLLGIAKPSGLPTMPGGGDFMEHTLLSLVRRRFPEAGSLHRLGRGTSGVVLFAVNPEAASRMSGVWRSGNILKVYRALGSGCPAADEFAINTRIGPVPHPFLGTVHAACADGKPAQSFVKVLERRDGCFVARIRITTGRPHQIRIHLAASGHPLVGDPLYEAGGVPAENSRALPGDLGYHLHSELLGFPHPHTGVWTEISCAPPLLLRIAAGRCVPAEF